MMAEMFALTASHCGTLICDRSLSDSQRSPCYCNEPFAGDAIVEVHTQVVDDDFLIGPVNDVAFLQLTGTIPASLCEPFATEVRSSRHLDTATRAERGSKTSREDGQLIGCFEIYDVIRPLYAPPVDFSAP